MGSPVARLGDTSNHGGTITTASSKNLNVNGKAVAVNGDLHSCPISGHGMTPITSTATTKSNGQSVVTVGCVAGCGAVINSGSPNVSAG